MKTHQIKTHGINLKLIAVVPLLKGRKISNRQPTLDLKKLEKEEQTKPKEQTKQKEENKNYGMNKLENRKTEAKNETKADFLKRSTKLTNLAD